MSMEVEKGGTHSLHFPSKMVPDQVLVFKTMADLVLADYPRSILVSQ